MAPQAHLGAARLSVLVIDDDPSVRELLDDFLRGEGFEVTTLADPMVAIASAANRAHRCPACSGSRPCSACG